MRRASRPRFAAPPATWQSSAGQIRAEKVSAVKRHYRRQPEARPHHAGDHRLPRRCIAQPPRGRSQHIPEVVVPHRRRVPSPVERIRRRNARPHYCVHERGTQRIVINRHAQIQAAAKAHIDKLQHDEHDPYRHSRCTNSAPTNVQTPPPLPHFHDEDSHHSRREDSRE